MCDTRRPALEHRQPPRRTLGLGAGQPPLDLTISWADFLRLEAQSARDETVHPALAPSSTAPAESAPSDLVRRVAGVLASPARIEIEQEFGRVEITADGATAELTTHGVTAGAEVEYEEPESATVYAEHRSSGGTRTRVSLNLGDQTVQFRTSYEDIRFSATVNSDRWQIKFSWGQRVPDLSSLDSVFREAEQGIRDAAAAVGTMVDHSNITAVAHTARPHLEPLRDAIDTAGRIASIRRGVSLQLSASGPMSPDSDRPFQVQALLTVTF